MYVCQIYQTGAEYLFSSVENLTQKMNTLQWWLQDNRTLVCHTVVVSCLLWAWLCVGVCGRGCLNCCAESGADEWRTWGRVPLISRGGHKGQLHKDSMAACLPCSWGKSSATLDLWCLSCLSVTLPCVLLLPEIWILCHCLYLLDLPLWAHRSLSPAHTIYGSTSDFLHFQKNYLVTSCYYLCLCCGRSARGGVMTPKLKNTLLDDGIIGLYTAIFKIFAFKSFMINH